MAASNRHPGDSFVLEWESRFDIAHGIFSKFSRLSPAPALNVWLAAAVRRIVPDIQQARGLR